MIFWIAIQRVLRIRSNYINDPKIIALNDKVVAINNAIEVDLYGQVCSESSGYPPKTGTGGQLDFIFGAFHVQGRQGNYFSEFHL